MQNIHSRNDARRRRTETGRNGYKSGIADKSSEMLMKSNPIFRPKLKKKAFIKDTFFLLSKTGTTIIFNSAGTTLIGAIIMCTTSEDFYFEAETQITDGVSFVTHLCPTFMFIHTRMNHTVIVCLASLLARWL